VVSELMALSDSHEAVLANASRYTLRFEGLGKDRREIYEIPAARNFFCAVHTQWPYWMHFLAPTPENFALVLLMLSQVQITSASESSAHQPEPGLKSARIMDKKHIYALVSQLYASMAVLHAHFGIDPKITNLMRDQFVGIPIFKENRNTPGHHRK
jgi:hypothetical protein